MTGYIYTRRKSRNLLKVKRNHRPVLHPGHVCALVAKWAWISTYLDHVNRILGLGTLTQHTSSNAASSAKGRADMCFVSTASRGTPVASVRLLFHMTTSRLEFTVTGMRVHVGTGWLGDKAQALTHECWSGTFPEKQLQRGWRDAVQIPRITRNLHGGRYGRHPNPVDILRITRNCHCGQ